MGGWGSKSVVRELRCGRGKGGVAVWVRVLFVSLVLVQALLTPAVVLFPAVQAFHVSRLWLTLSLGLTGVFGAVLVSGRAFLVPAVVAEVVAVQAPALTVADARYHMFLGALLVVVLREVGASADVALHGVFAQRANSRSFIVA